MSLWGRAVAARPVPRPKPQTSNQTVRQPQPEPAEPAPTREAEPTSVYHTPDAWPRKFGEAKPAPVEPALNPVGRPRMRTDQRRRNTISIALSEEEERFIRAAAAERGISISEWARMAFFRFMGRKVPEREMARRVWPESTGDEPVVKAPKKKGG